MLLLLLLVDSVRRGWLRWRGRRDGELREDGAKHVDWFLLLLLRWLLMLMQLQLLLLLRLHMLRLPADRYWQRGEKGLKRGGRGRTGRCRCGARGRRHDGERQVLRQRRRKGRRSDTGRRRSG